MNSLVSVRTNIYYSKKQKQDKKDKDEFDRLQELIFVVSKPAYRLMGDGQVLRENELDEFRFVVPEDVFESLIELLKNLKKADESELV